MKFTINATDMIYMATIPDVNTNLRKFIKHHIYGQNRFIR